MNVDDMPAGREIDVLVAECVMGLPLSEKQKRLPNHLKGGLLVIPHYSTDIGDAMAVAQRIAERLFTRVRGDADGIDLDCSQGINALTLKQLGSCEESGWTAAFICDHDLPYEWQEPPITLPYASWAPTAPLAICRAALKVAGEKA